MAPHDLLPAGSVPRRKHSEAGPTSSVQTTYCRRPVESGRTVLTWKAGWGPDIPCDFEAMAFRVRGQPRKAQWPKRPFVSILSLTPSNYSRHELTSRGHIIAKGRSAEELVASEPTVRARTRSCRGYDAARDPDRHRGHRLISRVDIRPDCVEISVRRSRGKLLGSDSIDLVMQQAMPNNQAKDVLTLTARARLHWSRRSRRWRYAVYLHSTLLTTKLDKLEIVSRSGNSAGQDLES